LSVAFGAKKYRIVRKNADTNSARKLALIAFPIAAITCLRP
jgi:hypothetical protein